MTTGKCVAVEPAFGQGLHFGGGGPDELAADARLLATPKPSRAEVDDLLIIPSAHATDHAAEHGLGHGVGGLESGVGLQRRPRRRRRSAAPGDGRSAIFWPARVADAPLVAVPGVGAVGLTLVARGRTAGSPRPPGGWRRPAGPVRRPGSPGSPASGRATRRDPGAAGSRGRGPMGAAELGRLRLVSSRAASHRLVSRRFLLLIKGKSTSSLATGREEPPLHFSTTTGTPSDPLGNGRDDSIEEGQGRTEANGGAGRRVAHLVAHGSHSLHGADPHHLPGPARATCLARLSAGNDSGLVGNPAVNSYPIDPDGLGTLVMFAPPTILPIVEYLRGGKSVALRRTMSRPMSVTLFRV